ncbi:hypothetical protein VTJ04DRAFT_4094, partial [Mycothermus thermophilus]
SRRAQSSSADAGANSDEENLDRRPINQLPVAPTEFDATLTPEDMTS